MADYSDRPVATMPGSRSDSPAGAMCDRHPDRSAARRVQGETDSFGCEYTDLCTDCLAELAEHEKQAKHGRCDWCGKEADDLRPRRDYEEGMAGPVYDVCGACVRRENEQLTAELEEDDGWWD